MSPKYSGHPGSWSAAQTRAWYSAHPNVPRGTPDQVAANKPRSHQALGFLVGKSAGLGIKAIGRKRRRGKLKLAALQPHRYDWRRW